MIRIRVVRGSRAGEVIEPAGDAVRIGRDPEADLRFDPDRDLEVSARHALLFRNADRWFIRDLGSTNGTYLNGVAITGDVEVVRGARIEFGTGGPMLEVDWSASPSAPAAQESRTGKLRAHYKRQQRQLRAIAVVLGIALIAVAARLMVVSNAGRRDRATWERERSGLLARIDTLLVSADQVVNSLRGELAGLAGALRASETEVRETRAALENLPARTSADSVDRLRRQLRSATEALARQQLAASLDFAAIESANRSAVALIWVQAQSGEVSTASGFAVRSDGLIVTARHALAGPDGSRRPRRVAVQFSDSDQVFPARIIALSDEEDVALIAVDNILGGVPIVSGLHTPADTLRNGAPVAVIGFPLGGDAEMPVGARRAVLRPLVSAALVTGVSADRLDFQGYGAAGASGSPMFDERGRVASILTGGLNRDGVSTLVGIPAAAAVRLIERVR